MSLFRIVMLVIAAGFVSACSTPHSTMRNASPTDASLPASAQEAAQQSAQVAFMPNASINSITVDVPNSLTVSEANSYFPRGDIVWRGDIFGDRHEQVKTIIERSAAQLKQSLTGTRPVDLHIRVTRFHGLSEKARYSTGGVHNINFILTVTDPATGVILRGPKTVVSNLLR